MKFLVPEKCNLPTWPTLKEFVVVFARQRLGNSFFIPKNPTFVRKSTNVTGEIEKEMENNNLAMDIADPTMSENNPALSTNTPAISENTPAMSTTNPAEVKDDSAKPGMGWFHCNKCGIDRPTNSTNPSVPSEPSDPSNPFKFVVTNCGHIFCSNCVQTGATT